MMLNNVCEIISGEIMQKAPTFFHFFGITTCVCRFSVFLYCCFLCFFMQLMADQIFN